MLNASIFSPFLSSADRPPYWVAGFALLVLIYGCSSPRRPPSAEDPALRRYAERAYQPERRFAAETLTQHHMARQTVASAHTQTMAMAALLTALVADHSGNGQIASAP
jgi:hypothetical protein